MGNLEMRVHAYNVNLGETICGITNDQAVSSLNPDHITCTYCKRFLQQTVTEETAWESRYVPAGSEIGQDGNTGKTTVWEISVPGSDTSIMCTNEHDAKYIQHIYENAPGNEFSYTLSTREITI